MAMAPISETMKTVTVIASRLRFPGVLHFPLRFHVLGRALFLHLRVAVPTSLDDAQRALVEQLHQSFGGGEAAPAEEGFLSKVFGSDKGKKKRK